MDKTKLQKETSDAIDHLETLLDQVAFPPDEAIDNPDRRMPSSVCNLLRMFHERLRDVEGKLNITDQ